MFDTDKTKREVDLFIFDIYVASLKIKEVASGFDNVQNLLHDFRSWDSVIREFEIIGEATKYLLKEKLIEKEYQIIVDLRNYITHEYFGVDQDRIWNIISNDLDSYIDIILELITNIEPELKQELMNSFIEDNKHLTFITKSLKNLQPKKDLNNA